MDPGKIIGGGSPRKLINAHVPKSRLFSGSCLRLRGEAILGITGVKSVKRSNENYEVSADNPQVTLVGVFELARDKGCLLEELIVKNASLDCVFLKLTGNRNRQ